MSQEVITKFHEMRFRHRQEVEAFLKEANINCIFNIYIKVPENKRLTTEGEEFFTRISAFDEALTIPRSSSLYKHLVELLKEEMSEEDYKAFSSYLGVE